MIHQKESEEGKRKRAAAWKSDPLPTLTTAGVSGCWARSDEVTAAMFFGVIQPASSPVPADPPKPLLTMGFASTSPSDPGTVDGALDGGALDGGALDGGAVAMAASFDAAASSAPAASPASPAAAAASSAAAGSAAAVAGSVAASPWEIGSGEMPAAWAPPKHTLTPLCVPFSGCWYQQTCFRRHSSP